jgi:hypothetical protein
MAERHPRRYTRRQKITAVIAADMTSTEAASEVTGIPRTTIGYWLDDPEFVELRHNARERMAEEAMAVARLAWGKLAERIKAGDIETRDLVLATGMATDKTQLLTGGATARSENRDITGTITDVELSAAIREAEALVAGGSIGTTPPAEDPPES